MKRIRVSLAPAAVIATVSLVMVVLAGPASGASEQWVYPVGPPGGPVEVVRGFAPPDQRWRAGHRGVDLGAVAGADVRAAGAGTISYAGLLAGRGVVVVDHGATRTTYQPVSPSVAVGDVVEAGHPIGSLAHAGSHCAPDACLHWGLRAGDRYLDPLQLVRDETIRLLPLGERALTGEPPPPPARGAATLRWPVPTPRITSPFGMRVHPVTGVRKLHDGTDLAARCGSPVTAAAAGHVEHTGERGAYGRQVTIGHGILSGTTMTTSYSHLSRALVSPGQVVEAGQVIGAVGNTGTSTGCHLHFMTYADGVLADPERWLPTARRSRRPHRGRRLVPITADRSRWPPHPCRRAHSATSPARRPRT